jgi:uncharacterized iron-regulated membrane protein
VSGPAGTPWVVVASLIALGLTLPVFGLSLLVVILIERAVLSRIQPVREWLGLT